MFIRAAKSKRKSKSEEGVVYEYEYLKLIESYRTEKGPRQKLILNLGPLPLKKSEYKGFVIALEGRLSGQKSLIRKHRRDSQFMGMVNESYEKLMRKKAEPIKPTAEEDVRQIDIKSHKITAPKSIGPEYLCHSIWNQLGLSKWLRGQGVSPDQIVLMEGLVLGRLIEPGSELACKEWLENRSGLFDINPIKDELNLNKYYRTGDKLYQLKTELEKHLRQKEKTLFNLSDTIVLYDLTNTYLEGTSKQNPKAKKGRSKQKKSGNPLVTLGLVVDEKGFSKYSKSFDGNVSESSTLEEMINHLDDDYKSGIYKKTVVLDAGIATAKTTQWLKDYGYSYIVCYRGKCPFDIKEKSGEEIIIESDNTSNVKIKTIKHMHEGDTYLWCHSERRQAKEKSMRSLKETRLLELLSYYKDGLSKPRRTKKYAKLIEMVGRLKERYAYAAKLYAINVIPEKGKAADDPSLKAVDLTWELVSARDKKDKEHEGSYVLRTDKQLSNNEIWNTYIMLNRIENAFRCMKSHLGFRPIFHQTERRTDAHLFISVLAYHILHIIEYQLRQHDDHRSWHSIRKALSTHQTFILEYRELSNDQHWITHHTRMCSEANQDQKNIYKVFNLSPAPFSKKHFFKQM